MKRIIRAVIVMLLASGDALANSDLDTIFYKTTGEGDRIYSHLTAKQLADMLQEQCYKIPNYDTPDLGRCYVHALQELSSILKDEVEREIHLAKTNGHKHLIKPILKEQKLFDTYLDYSCSEDRRHPGGTVGIAFHHQLYYCRMVLIIQRIQTLINYNDSDLF